MILRLAQHESNGDHLYWDDMRKHDYSISFPAVSGFVRQQSGRIRRPMRNRNRLIWILSVLMPILIFLSCQRKTYIEPQGATLSFTANDSLFTEIDDALKQYAGKEWKAVFKPREGTMRGVISTSAEQYPKLRELSEKLKRIKGINEIYLSALKTGIKESRASHLSYQLFNLHFHAINVSDEQLHKAIQSRLKEAGQHDVGLKLVLINGRKQLDIYSNGNTRNFSIELTLQDGTNVIAVAEKW